MRVKEPEGSLFIIANERRSLLPERAHQNHASDFFRKPGLRVIRLSAAAEVPEPAGMVADVRRKRTEGLKVPENGMHQKVRKSEERRVLRQFCFKECRQWSSSENEEGCRLYRPSESFALA
jgi:hypothetical protein